MKGIGDLFVVVPDKATYDAAVTAGKTSPSVMYLVLAERQMYFNGEPWTGVIQGGGDAGGVTKDELTDVEHVAASAFLDHNGRLDALDDHIAALYSRDEVIAELRRIITVHEEVTAAALADLDYRLKNQ